MLLHARSYLDIGARVGLGGLKYDCNYGTTMPGYHAAFDVGYLYKSPYWIAFRLGATIESASSSYRKAGYEDAYTVTDVENESMVVSYNIGLLRERHYTWSASFPVQIGFHLQHFTVLVGPRFTLPIGGSWNQSIADAALAVYYPKYDNLVEESYPLAATRNFAVKDKGSLVLPAWHCAFAGEITYDFLIASSYGKSESFISVGLYFDASLMTAPTYPNNEQYGILRLSDTRDGFPLTRHNQPVLQAWRENNPLVASMRPFDVGIKVAYHLTSAPRQKRTKHGCNCDE